MNPFEIFRDWYAEELKVSKVRIPSACCFSTIGLDGFPNSRFLSLKEILNDTFIITGPLNSRKGLEIDQDNKTALIFWWTETEKQVRIQGEATKFSNELADKYFNARERETQIVSTISLQGQALLNPDKLKQQCSETEKKFKHQPIPRPKNWGGFSIKPIRIEFFEFKSSRFHERTLFELLGGQWKSRKLQP